MAKRGTLGHPRTSKLARALNMPAWAALGLLEAFWHWAGRYAPTGLLDQELLESAMDGSGISGDHAAALVETGWLDPLEDETIWIHSWHEHADDTVKKNLKAAKKSFAMQSNPTVSRITRESFANRLRSCSETHSISLISQSQSQSQAFDNLLLREKETVEKVKRVLIAVAKELQLAELPDDKIAKMALPGSPLLGMLDRHPEHTVVQVIIYGTKQRMKLPLIASMADKLITQGRAENWNPRPKGRRSAAGARYDRFADLADAMGVSLDE